MLKRILTATALITPLAMLAAPLAAQEISNDSLAGTWTCQGQSGDRQVTETIEIRKNGRYQTEMAISGKTQGRAVSFKGTIKGRYSLDGGALTTTPSKVKATAASVDGLDLMGNAQTRKLVDDQLTAQVNAMEGQRQIHAFSGDEMVLGKSKTTCTRN